MSCATVAVLFAAPRSVYKGMAGLDVYDKARDARSFAGGLPVVSHPPCRAFSRMHAFAKPEPGEVDLVLEAVETVRRCGGVLEHPAGSRLWPMAGLPEPGKSDSCGFSICVDQWWFGHPARKRTLLYVVGMEVSQLPRWPLILGDAPAAVRSEVPGRSRCTKRQRSATPPLFAEWLVEVARRVRSR